MFAKAAVTSLNSTTACSFMQFLVIFDSDGLTPTRHTKWVMGKFALSFEWNLQECRISIYTGCVCVCAVCVCACVWCVVCGVCGVCGVCVRVRVLVCVCVHECVRTCVTCACVRVCTYGVCVCVCFCEYVCICVYNNVLVLNWWQSWDLPHFPHFPSPSSSLLCFLF